MLNWKFQGPALATDVRLSDGRIVKAVLVADSANPNGAVVLVPQADGSMQTTPIGQLSDQLAVGDLIEITLLQTRAFGNTDLPKPEVVA